LSPPESVLIVRLSSIGDVIHTFPAYVALRNAWPSTRFGWAVERAAAELVRRLPGPLRVHELDIQWWRRRWIQPSTLGAIREQVGTLRGQRYQLAIDFQGLLKSAVVARLGASRTLGWASASAREPWAARLYHQTAVAPNDVHVVRRCLHLAQQAGTTLQSIEWPRLTRSADQAYINAYLADLGAGDPIVLHPAANWPSKRYEPERLVRVARELHERTRRPVIWIWGPGEESATRSLATAAGIGSHASVPTTLPQLGALLERTALFIGGDSAPLHLAVACGAPSVAIFGPTDPARLGPLVATDKVICERLECSHCHQRRCPLGTNACLDAISTQQIVTAALTRLEQEQ
jgi:lipopolysaccharide heptosyltransferase I